MLLYHLRGELVTIKIEALNRHFLYYEILQIKRIKLELVIIARMMNLLIQKNYIVKYIDLRTKT